MKLSKVFSVIMISVMLIASMGNVAFAEDEATGTTIGGVTINPDTSGTAATQVGTIGNKIIGIVQTVGTVASIIVIIVLGIKYMMGSAEEKAEYKKTLMPYLIGAVLVLLGVNIVKWISTGITGFFG